MGTLIAWYPGKLPVGIPEADRHYLSARSFLVENGGEQRQMQRLWAPWRSRYIQSFEEEKSPNHQSCFLCDAIQAINEDAKRYVVYRAAYSFVILNLYPYNGGHIMVAPYRHTGNLEDLSRDELHNLCDLLRDAIVILKREFHPEGFNIGANLGKVAGAGLPDHLHFHIVPRWSGDTNFMPILADIKVVSQSLDEVYHRLQNAFTEYYQQKHSPSQ